MSGRKKNLRKTLWRAAHKNGILTFGEIWKGFYEICSKHIRESAWNPLSAQMPDL